MKNLYVETVTIGGVNNGAEIEVELLKNDGPTGMKCTLRYPTSPQPIETRIQCSDTTNSVGVTAGDRIIFTADHLGTAPYPLASMKAALTVE